MARVFFSPLFLGRILKSDVTSLAGTSIYDAGEITN